jgi:hypothetical protein
MMRKPPSSRNALQSGADVSIAELTEKRKRLEGCAAWRFVNKLAAGARLRSPLSTEGWSAVDFLLITFAHTLEHEEFAASTGLPTALCIV